MKVLFVSGYAENTVLRHGAIDVPTAFCKNPLGFKSLAVEDQARPGYEHPCINSNRPRHKLTFRKQVRLPGTPN